MTDQEPIQPIETKDSKDLSKNLLKELDLARSIVKKNNLDEYSLELLENQIEVISKYIDYCNKKISILGEI